MRTARCKRFEGHFWNIAIGRHSHCLQPRRILRYTHQHTRTMDRSITAKPHSVQLRYLLSGQDGVFIRHDWERYAGRLYDRAANDLLHGGVAGHGGHLGDLRGQVGGRRSGLRRRPSRIPRVRKPWFSPGQALDLLVHQGVDARLPRLGPGRCRYGRTRRWVWDRSARCHPSAVPSPPGSPRANSSSWFS